MKRLYPLRYPSLNVSGTQHRLRHPLDRVGLLRAIYGIWTSPYGALFVLDCVNSGPDRPQARRDPKCTTRMGRPKIPVDEGLDWPRLYPPRRGETSAR